jgi:hypothetical protein
MCKCFKNLLHVFQQHWQALIVDNGPVEIGICFVMILAGTIVNNWSEEIG